MTSANATSRDQPSPPPIIPPGLTAAEGALELVPIPAALIGDRGGRLYFEAYNTRFARAGMAGLADRSPLLNAMGGAIVRFLSGHRSSITLPWKIGDTVETRHYDLTLTRLTNRTEAVCLAALVERTGEVRAQDNLRREMTTDSLTGLANRGGFIDLLEERLADGPTGFAVLMIDLAQFSRINACLGSLAGDELLITVARRIKGALRGSDVLARTGGDEFGVLMALENGVEDAERLARRITGALETPFRLNDYEICVSCAIGMSPGAAGGDAEDIIRQAQFAMKRAKRSARLEIYEPRAFDSAREQFAMETALRRAIGAGQLSMHFQPIVDLATRRPVAFEALARWTDEDGRFISPDAFIPAAEESGLIVPLGRWAIDKALSTLAEWDRRTGGASDVAVTVNLSAIQLQRDDIAPVVERALRDHGLAGHRLKLELTESALVSDPDRIAGILHALKALGTTLAMDDFGTGYSNLAYLQRLPIDTLKIDRSFVTDMLADRDKVAIVRAVLSLAQALGMQTVAEGIESEELGQTLAALGCTYGQGYAYARPLPAEAAFRYLADRSA